MSSPSVTTGHKKKPHGARRSQFDVGRDIEKVTQMLELGWPRQTIIRQFGNRKVPPDVRTIDRWIAEARLRWKVDHKESRDTAVERHLARLYSHVRAASKDKAYGPIAALEKVIASIEGTQAPEKHLVAVANVQAPTQQLDIGAYSDGELEQLETLLVKGQKPVLALPEAVADAVVVNTNGDGDE